MKLEAEITNISEELDYLCDLCLEEDTFRGYTSRDLFNATEVFAHILLDVQFLKGAQLPKKKRELLAEETGKAIRELIIAATGIDMHAVAANLTE
jgi:hypothetical protein